MDDLSGLDWSSKASGAKPKLPPMNPGSYPSLRPTPSPLASGRNTPLSAQGSGSAAPKAAPAKPSQDTFSNLMNFGPAKSNQNLTLAERQAQLEIEKRKKEEERRKQTEAQYGNGQQWDNLGTQSYTASPSLQKPPPSNGTKNDDDDLFAAFNRDTKVDSSSHYPPPESRKSTPANAPKLDLSSPNAWNPAGGTNGGSTSLGVEDDDPFGLSELKPRTSPAPVQKTDDDDDFLGDLARPVDEVRMKQQQQQKQAPRGEPGKPIEADESSSSEDERPASRPPAARQTKATNDPFDRAVAQLMGYGFTPEDARRGLVESESGGNVQAAANWLLDDAHRKSKAKAAGGRGSPASSSQPERKNSGTGTRSDADLTKSAAAVGNSLFKTANSLWRTGQKKLQKTVADFQQEGGGDPSQPKWMRDAQQGRTEESQTAEAKGTDEAMMLESGGRPTPVRNNSRQNPEPRPAAQPSRGSSPGLSSGGQSRASPVPRWQQQSAPPAANDARSRLNRLATDDDSFSMHVSANRRKKSAPPPEPRGQEPEPDLLFNTTAPKPSQSLPQRTSQRDTPPPAKRPQGTPTSSRQATPHPARQIPPITPAALQTSTKHRLEGTAHFKRGDYATAHTSYSSSLAAVPSTHPLMILLLTNRALTALKTGEPKQAVADADEALKLIGPGNGKGETVAVKGETGQDESRDMKDIFGKALSRKAEALEQMEKWADASAVWHQCVESGVGGPTAVKGRQRCQDALTPKPKATPKPAAKPRPKPSATASLAPQKSSEAVTRLRAANEAAAKEDDEKFALSEAVDARVAAWRDGKRDNLRALLGSMDAVLWEGSGWKKVGLHELVMANKVKIAYMKAIAKTHPDKLPQDANTEVRLIAGLVFSTLNDSWEKFKAENGM